MAPDPHACPPRPARNAAPGGRAPSAPPPGRRDCGRKLGAALLLALGPGGLSRALLSAPPGRGAGLARREPWRLQRPRGLWVTRPQAQESVRCVYWADARLQPEGYAALNRIYRDVHAGIERPIALGLLDLNFALQCAVHALFGPRPMVLFSGYRTQATNRLIGGTEASVHASGAADDFIYEGLSLLENYRLARYFQVGGLGLYPDRGSLHKDVARRRSWITRGR